LSLGLHRLGVDRRVCAVASVIFISRGISYEVVTWITELSYLSVVVYTLLTFSWWDRYLGGQGARYLGWTVAGFAAAVFTIEHALLLLPLYFLFDLIVRPKKSLWFHVPPRGERKRDWWRQHRLPLLKDSMRYVPFLLVALALFTVKSAHHHGLVWSSMPSNGATAAAPVPPGAEVTARLPAERTWFGMLNTPRRAYLDLLLSASYLFLPIGSCYGAEDSWLTRHPWLCLLPWLVVHLWVAWKGRPVTRFLLAWVYVYMLPLALAGVPEARYYYMATVPAAGLLGLLLHAVWSWLSRWVRVGVLGPVIVALLALLIYGEGIFVRARLEEWKVASGLVQRTLAWLRQDLDSETRGVYLVNLPWGVPGPFWTAYAFENAAEYLPLMLRPPRPDVRAYPVYDRSFVGGRWPTIGTYMSLEQVRERLREPQFIAYQFVADPPRIIRMR